ncbi:MAG: hypothetical protein AB8G11_19770 [Saprospiraceae bacterium]
MSILSKTAYYAKEAFKFAMRIILPFAIGIFLNWVFALVFFINWLGDATWSSSIGTILLTALFIVGFPFLYFWLGRGNALRQGAAGLYQSGHDTIEKLVGNITKAAVVGSQTTGLGSVFAGDKVKDKKGFIKGLEDKLPRPIRFILSFILEEIPIAAALTEVGQTTELKKENLPTIQPIVQRRVDEYVETRLVGDSVTFFWILVGVNVAVMAAAWYFLG